MNLESGPEAITFPDIAQKLNAMAERDQAMREQSEQGDSWDESVDTENTKQLQAIITEIGWPTISKVGRKAAEHAWLLAQHADHDVTFQAECLNAMREAPMHEIEAENLAYLWDRVLVNQGQPQKFGTQFRQIGGKHVLATPLADEAEVDAERAAFGMGPLKEQFALMNEKYPLKPNDDD